MFLEDGDIPIDCGPGDASPCEWKATHTIHTRGGRTIEVMLYVDDSDPNVEPDPEVAFMTRQEYESASPASWSGLPDWCEGDYVLYCNGRRVDDADIYSVD